MSQAVFSPSRETGVSLSQIAFRVSNTVARSHSTVDQVIRVLRESRRFGWISLQILDPVQPDPQRWEFAWPPEHENEVLLRADAQTDFVSVAVDAAVPAKDADEASILLKLVAQQLALFDHREELVRRNDQLMAECKVIGEQLDLAKFMDRAKSLIIRRRGLSADEAEEWLVGASVRFRKPLLNVAQDIVMALKTPGFAA
jgi:ANTAR domain